MRRRIVAGDAHALHRREGICCDVALPDSTPQPRHRCTTARNGAWVGLCRHRNRLVGSAHAPNKCAGLAPRDDESAARCFIRRRMRRRIVAGDAHALRLHRYATARNGAWVGLGAASSADARPWRAQNPTGAKRQSDSAQPMGRGASGGHDRIPPQSEREESAISARRAPQA